MAVQIRTGFYSYSKRLADGSFESDRACVPCDACVITLSEGTGGSGYDSGGVAYTAYLKSIENICTAASYTVNYTHDTFGVAGNRFQVQANDVDVYNSGCVTTGSVSGSFSIPAGTKKILIQVDGNCNGASGQDLWTFTLTCA